MSLQLKMPHSFAVAWFALLIVLSLRAGYGIRNRKVAKISSRVVIAGVLTGVSVKCFASFNSLALVLLVADVYFKIMFLAKGPGCKQIHLVKTVGRENDEN